jgi:ABC-type sugar transport system substrate-binding protein
MFLLLTLVLTLGLATVNIHAAPTRTIGATIWNMSVPFYSNFIKGLHDGAAKYGLKLLLRDGQGDPNTQVAIVRQFITEKVDLILIVPGDAQAVVPVLQQANTAQIPVITVNNKAGKGAEVVTFVGADDYYFGKQQGKLLVQAIGSSGNIGYLMGTLGTSAQVMRKKGFDDYLQSYRDSKRSEVKFILGDYPKDVRQAIQKGIVYGTVNQDPYPQAVEGMHMASLYLSGKKSEIPSPNYFLELPLITKENVSKYNAAW